MSLEAEMVLLIWACLKIMISPQPPQQQQQQHQWIWADSREFCSGYVGLHRSPLCTNDYFGLHSIATQLQPNPKHHSHV